MRRGGGRGGGGVGVCVSVVPCCVSPCYCRVCGAPTGRLVAGASLAATPSSREPTALERLGKWPKGYAIAYNNNYAKFNIEFSVGGNI